MCPAAAAPFTCKFSKLAKHGSRPTIAQQAPNNPHSAVRKEEREDGRERTSGQSRPILSRPIHLCRLPQQRIPKRKQNLPVHLAIPKYSKQSCHDVLREWVCTSRTAIASTCVGRQTPGLRKPAAFDRRLYVSS